MATPAPTPSVREVPVHINVDAAGTITVQPPTFWVVKGENQEVVWDCTGPDPRNPPEFTVDFEKNGSPFYESQFSSVCPCSGLVCRNVLPGPKIYNYTVRVGVKSLDPGGGVQ